MLDGRVPLARVQSGCEVVGCCWPVAGTCTNLIGYTVTLQFLLQSLDFLVPAQQLGFQHGHLQLQLVGGSRGRVA